MPVAALARARHGKRFCSNYIMKRSLESPDGNFEFDLPELDVGFLDALLAEDPKKLRAQGGKPVE